MMCLLLKSEPSKSHSHGTSDLGSYAVGLAGRNERAKQPLGCLGDAPRKIFWISDLLRSFLVQSGDEIA